MTETRQQRRAKERSKAKGRESGSLNETTQSGTQERIKPSWTSRAKANAAAAVLCAVGTGLIVFTEAVAPAVFALVLFAVAGGLILKFRGQE